MTTPVPVVAVAEVFRALASPKRLQILEWLRDPVANFPPQRAGLGITPGWAVNRYTPHQ